MKLCLGRSFEKDDFIHAKEQKVLVEILNWIQVVS